MHVPEIGPGISSDLNDAAVYGGDVFVPASCSRNRELYFSEGLWLTADFPQQELDSLTV